MLFTALHLVRMRALRLKKHWPLFEQCLSKASGLLVDGCHWNIWKYVSQYWSRCTEGDGEERETSRGTTLFVQEEKVDHTGHKKTPTTRASPFIVHNTSLFTLHSKSVHVVYSDQLIATEALDKGSQNKKKRDLRRLVSNPFHLIQKGEGKRKEAGYFH